MAFFSCHGFIEPGVKQCFQWCIFSVSTDCY